jgi:glycosyltransferase involved in cell wall biosynthesis
MNKGENRILFVTEESINGVFTVISSLIESWPSDDKIFLLSNRLHWAKDELDLMSKNLKFVLLKSPFYSPIDVYKLSKLKGIKLGVLKLLIKLLTPIYLVYTTYELIKILKKYRINVVFSHNGGLPGGFLPRCILYAAKVLKIKNIIAIIHNYPVTPKVKIYSFFRNILISNSVTEIVSVSKAVANSINLDTNIKKEIKIIHNGIKLDSDSEMNLKQLPNWRKRENLILFLGELSHRKGLHVLIESLSNIPNNFCLVVFGSGEDENYINYCKDLVLKYSLSENVFFEGFDINAKNYIKFFDILILPSLYGESLPMVILEAFKNKTTVISTNVGGISEIVKSRETGILIEPYSQSELSASIIELLTNKDLSNQLSSNAFELLKNDLSINKCIDKYKNLINS